MPDSKVKTYRTAAQLAGLPKNIWDLFLPDTDKELQDLEKRLGQLPKWEKDRAQVIALQKQYGMPFHPNMSGRDLGIRIRIELLRKRNGYYEDYPTD